MKADNICISFDGRIILDNYTYDFPDGKCTAIMGRSGIGKTTLLRILAGLQRADSGSVETDPSLKKSFVFQENRLIESKSVLENILCVAPDKNRALSYLEKTGLIGDVNKKAGQLSGGMKRRLSLARCLAYGGDIFFLDEPLRELDSATADEMTQLIKNELAGKTVILVVHDEKQAEYLADEICYIE